MRGANDGADAEGWERDAELHARVLKDMIENPQKYDDIPNGSLLILVPNDDPAQLEWAIRQGANAVRDGVSVYLRRIDVADLPTVSQRSIDEPIGTRRIVFGTKGKIRRVTVRNPDLSWQDVAPTSEDAAGLPPIS
jgi:hypothetical protein